MVELDEAKLSRSVSSLVSNGVRYAPPGTNVVLHASRPGTAFEVVVSDRARASRRADHERIFDAFTSTILMSVRDWAGARAVATPSCTAVGSTVSSVPGNGATFTLRLPVGELEDVSR